jgi:sodium transport system permease protein
MSETPPPDHPSSAGASRGAPQGERRIPPGDAWPPQGGASSPQGGDQLPRTPTRRSVLLLLGVVVLLYFVVGIPVQIILGPELGIVFTQLGVFLGVTLIFVARGGYDPVETLSLRLPSGRQVWGGLLLLAGATPVAWILAWLQSHVIEVPVELLEAMGDFLQADDPMRVLWLLFVIALIPALCEETLFRGAILSGLRRRHGMVAAVLLNGALFGLLHAPQAVFRFLPTAWLGVVLAWVAWETRALWLAVLLHAVNNGAILLVTVIPATREATSDVEAAPPLILAPLALLLLVLGARVLRAGSPAAPAPSPPSSP